MKTHHKLLTLIGGVTMCLVMGASAAYAAVPTFTFKGDGYGHGLGMSQVGTLSRADKGQNATTILKAYFPGTTLTKKTNLSNESVIVALDDGKVARSSWSVRPGYISSGFRLGSTEKIYDDRGSVPYTFKVVDGQICLFVGSQKVRTILNSSVDVVPVNGTPDLMEVTSTSGPFNRANIRYRGKLRIKMVGTKLHLYNIVSVQNYLYGVVPRELGATYYNAASAASRTQAICARSYAYDSIINGNILYCTTMSQVYGGHSRWTTSSRTATYNYEEAQSNNAVDATNNLCVTYNDRVVKTYFSSCNGSHTAHNEDIWGGTPLPYLSGVDDSRYTDRCTNHVWTVTKTGMEVATTLKQHGISVAGAGTKVYVSRIELTKGHDGWNKAATIYWSDGQKSTINLGDNVRIKLGLKSARFSVTSTGDSAIPSDATVKRIQENSYAVRLYGTSWGRYAISGTSGGYHASTNKKGTYFLVKFKGDGISWIGTKSPQYGKAKVYVDGVYKKTINLRTSGTYRMQRLYTITGLKNTDTHTLKVVNAPYNTAGDYAYLSLDAADIVDGAPLKFLKRTYEETNSLISHQVFSTVTYANYSGGQAYRTVVAGKAVRFRVKAQKVTICGKKSPNGGRFKVYVNGAYTTTIDTKADTTSYTSALYTHYSNPAAVTEIRLVSTTKSGSTKAGEVVFDRFVTYDGVLCK